MDTNKLKEETYVLFDFFTFGFKRYEFSAKVWLDLYHCSESKIEKKFAFIEIFCLRQQLVETVAAYFFGLIRANSVQATLLKTLVTYENREIKAHKWIEGKTDDQLDDLLQLDKIYEKFNFTVEEKESSKYAFRQNMKIIAQKQEELDHVYMKTKHGNMIVSSHQVINPKTTNQTDSFAIASNQRKPNTIKVDDEEIDLIYKDIENSIVALRETVAIYAVGYNSFLREKLESSGVDIEGNIK